MKGKTDVAPLLELDPENSPSGPASTGEVGLKSTRGRTITSLATLPDRTLLDEGALAVALNLSKRTVRRMVVRHELPRPFRFGGKSTWLSGKVLEHIEVRAAREARESDRAARKLEAIS